MCVISLPQILTDLENCHFAFQYIFFSNIWILLRNWTKSRVDFSERFDPSDYKIGLKNFFHRSVFSKTPILYQDRYIDWVGEALIHFLNKSASDHFQMGQKEVIWPKEFLKSMHRDKSAKMAIWQKIATFPFWHFCPCASISKILLAKWLLVECYERPITHFCSKSVSGPVQGRLCTYPRG